MFNIQLHLVSAHSVTGGLSEDLNTLVHPSSSSSPVTNSLPQNMARNLKRKRSDSCASLGDFFGYQSDILADVPNVDPDTDPSDRSLTVPAQHPVDETNVNTLPGSSCNPSTLYPPPPVFALALELDTVVPGPSFPGATLQASPSPNMEDLFGPEFSSPNMTVEKVLSNQTSVQDVVEGEESDSLPSSSTLTTASTTIVDDYPQSGSPVSLSALDFSNLGLIGAEAYNSFDDIWSALTAGENLPQFQSSSAPPGDSNLMGELYAETYGQPSTTAAPVSDNAAGTVQYEGGGFFDGTTDEVEGASVGTFSTGVPGGPSRPSPSVSMDQGLGPFQAGTGFPLPVDLIDSIPAALAQNRLTPPRSRGGTPEEKYSYPPAHVPTQVSAASSSSCPSLIDGNTYVQPAPSTAQSSNNQLGMPYPSVAPYPSPAPSNPRFDSNPSTPFTFRYTLSPLPTPEYWVKVAQHLRVFPPPPIMIASSPFPDELNKTFLEWDHNSQILIIPSGVYKPPPTDLLPESVTELMQKLFPQIPLPPRSIEEYIPWWYGLKIVREFWRAHPMDALQLIGRKVGDHVNSVDTATATVSGPAPTSMSIPAPQLSLRHEFASSQAPPQGSGKLVFVNNSGPAQPGVTSAPTQQSIQPMNYVFKAETGQPPVKKRARTQ
ncbi:hypothetical protein EV361DRAFT_404082 [Lentinula raphanica]|uniref:Uncharacterized protein n=1 Tax=Lentinula raphanica TaxID=153919 RepID=A0AA38P239_9AGAR|nr:hypothetical protein F5878DRAFT_629741 [Lentinula raphanica]KAJ3975933.1 hypothetical protein EV361DRAFT_404082 [Lentinula raphanica]